MIFRGAIYLVNRGANSLSFSTFTKEVAVPKTLIPCMKFA